MAIDLGGLGSLLAGMRNLSFSSLFKSSEDAEKRGVSRVRTPMIEMELDQDLGRIWGTVRGGPDDGKSLDAMTRLQCRALYGLCCRKDPDGARLVEAYLDRRYPGWRSPAQNHLGDPDQRNAGLATMSKDEAYEVLGLPKGASEMEVVRSHRSLMKKLHPDHGGSTHLAARVNQAKDVLTRRHQQA
jgi:hypothetical protein